MDENVRGPADRRIEWTGERCVPWTDDLQVIYEHYHRYALAARFAVGARVLDLACGEGFGPALLATGAREVVGVDIDPPTVEHAAAHYSRENLHFAVGSLTWPTKSGTRSFPPTIMKANGRSAVNETGGAISPDDAIAMPVTASSPPR